ncbi:MAG: methylmalonyl Co-A mutase-associated GTPase MeaB [Acidimicrobiales bacterium]|nr:methylmalonyl Co-A mutase-associated GTPase MeaB [Acidimicrobiales bacterium]
MAERTMTQGVDELAAGIRSGDRRALARAITLVESSRPDDQERAAALLDELVADAGGALRVGITGSPGVGKSTFIEAYGLHLVETGHKVAVLAVDPSSQRTGGSILGDKTRMPGLASSPDAFIRPSPSGATLGGVARRTREAVTLCEAFGFDVVIIETVGAGQSEGTVADLVDVFVLLVGPGGGDDLQGIKRGIMELADVLVVTKADGDLAATARHTAGDYRHALELLRPKEGAGAAPVLACSSLAGEGIAEVADTVAGLRADWAASGRLTELRAGQAAAWMWNDVQARLSEAVHSHPAVVRLAPELEAQVTAGTLSPTTAARRLLDAFRPDAPS